MSNEVQTFKDWSLVGNTGINKIITFVINVVKGIYSMINTANRIPDRSNNGNFATIIGKEKLLSPGIIRWSIVKNSRCSGPLVLRGPVCETDEVWGI